MDTEKIKADLDNAGYCIVEDIMPIKEADHMADRYFKLHKQHFPDQRSYQSLQGLLNYDQMCWPWILQPQILELAYHYLGQNMRFAEACSKWVMPDTEAGNVHADALGLSEPFPSNMWLFQTMWMLTDFTENNGSTLVVPFSHRLRCNPSISPTDKCLIPIVGRRGSVLLWHGALWHASGANTTLDQHRMGLNLAYIPFWLNHAVGGWPPVHLETFQRMPRLLKELNQHRVTVS